MDVLVVSASKLVKVVKRRHSGSNSGTSAASVPNSFK